MTHRLFFYGTLCHLPLLEAVLGRALRKDEVQHATLSDYAVYWVQDQIFPCIVEEAGGVAEGIVFNADDDARARLNFYEGGFDYDLRMIVPSGWSDPVEVYFPAEGRWPRGAPWRLAEFERRHAAVKVAAAQQVMQLYGQIDAAEASRRLPMLWAMAEKAEVRMSPPVTDVRAGLGQADVSLADHNRAYDGFFAMDELTLSHQRFDGGQLGPLQRAVFVGVDAAMVLPYDPVRDRVLLVEQFRPGPFLRGDAAPWTLEPIAGRVDADETVEQAARREAEEEAGITLQHLLPISGHYPSPGASTEFYHAFLGIADLPDGIAGHGGKAGEGEDIRTHLLGFDALMALLDSGEATTGPLVLCALWLARHRDGLRATA